MKKTAIVSPFIDGQSLKLNALCISAIDALVSGWRYDRIAAFYADSDSVSDDEKKTFKSRRNAFLKQADALMCRACRATMKHDNVTYTADGLFEYASAIVARDSAHRVEAMAWIFRTLSLRTGAKKDSDEYVKLADSLVYDALTGVKIRKGMTYSEKDGFRARYTHVAAEFGEDDVAKLQRKAARQILLCLFDALLKKFGDDFIDIDGGMVNWKDFQKK